MKVGLYVGSIRPCETYQIVEATYLKVKHYWKSSSARGETVPRDIEISALES